MPLIPYVIEKSGREERVYDIYSRLLKDRDGDLRYDAVRIVRCGNLLYRPSCIHGCGAADCRSEGQAIFAT